ncbi:hypothetical protein [Chryseobacterium candidae]|uniref:hypothetical protein n=1 Tax=Chryseobacterium candidae TaxID=1978493 RepID=UPI0014563FF1|nr:hypothetical protein [Chryseobacterium candidae]
MKLLYSLTLLFLSMAGYGQENPYWFTDDIKKRWQTPPKVNPGEARWVQHFTR